MSSTKYAALVGRFQPFHNGHEMIIREMLHDGYTPLIFIGSINKQDEKNPYSFVARRTMLHAVFPRIVQATGIEDKEDDAAWFAQIHERLHRRGAEPSETPFYLWKQEHDYDWSDQVRKAGYWIRHLTPNPAYSDIHGSIIRKDLEGHRKYLHPYVYEYLRKGTII